LLNEKEKLQVQESIKEKIIVEWLDPEMRKELSSIKGNARKKAQARMGKVKKWVSEYNQAESPPDHGGEGTL